MVPKIVMRDDIKLIGMEYFGNNANGEIPQLWGVFIPRSGEIKNAAPNGAFYGVCECKCEGECQCGNGGSFLYTAAREVTSLDAVPEGMISRTLPPAKYAVFTHRGPIATLNQTFEKIYTEWLAANNLVPNAAYGFEYYDERFKEDAPDSELDIYVPVK